MASDATIGVRSLVAVLLAFTGRAPGRFALRSIDRVLHRLLRPRPRELWAGVSTLFSATLFPWILALVMADSRWWFGCDWLAIAWASFDVPMALAFGALAVGIRGARGWAASCVDLRPPLQLGSRGVTASQLPASTRRSPLSTSSGPTP